MNKKGKRKKTQRRETALLSIIMGMFEEQVVATGKENEKVCFT